MKTVVLALFVALVLSQSELLRCRVLTEFHQVIRHRTLNNISLFFTPSRWSPEVLLWRHQVLLAACGDLPRSKPSVWQCHHLRRIQWVLRSSLGATMTWTASYNNKRKKMTHSVFVHVFTGPTYFKGCMTLHQCMTLNQPGISTAACCGTDECNR